ncbi:Aste57867_23088 [Aphanomyces stellatus]|uniref:Aste57867_23088 protein n=1 Tax=Aphanomyces stellatus TaxID=120398 RepID=A0A485LM00_9STRA|nr:hypothetical protein As57867_023017 [Aphanomyces stellatus]VFT99736.1 Aste57867_23088 [Aphanomyces stellatus]
MDPKDDMMEKEDKDAVLPAFLSKTFEIFSTPSFAAICGWNATGDTIIIHDPDVFVKQVLPRFFKHRNLPSFVRQLNMYGFHKSVLDSNKREFRHKMFLRDKPELLRLIKRKVNTAPAVPAAIELKRDELSQEILMEMKSLKMKNELMEKRLRDVEIDNAIVRSDNMKLWKQLESAKEKQMIMQEKMKKIMWVLFQIYRGKHNQVPTLSTENGATILTEDLVTGSSRLGVKEFRDVLRFLAMDDPPLLQADGTMPTPKDKLQLPKGTKRKFVEVPTLSALPAPSNGASLAATSVFAPDKLFEIVESSPPRMPKAIKPKKPKSMDTALSIFSPPTANLSLLQPPPPPMLEKSHSFDVSNEPDMTGVDLMDDDLMLNDDSLNFGEVETENVMKKLEDFESSLLNEYDVTCLDSLLKQIHGTEKGPNQAVVQSTSSSL